ncbi:MAG: amidohydrolase family protein, partial [Candidatus Heimdallarchaeota archaeon]
MSIMNDYDILIREGKIIDGTGNPSYKADIEIKKGKIVKIGFNLSHNAIREINAKNLVIAPGFIDIHSHSDFAVMYDNRLESTLRQGITTAVIGNCGDSLAPINSEKVEEFKKLAEIFSPPDSTLNITWLTFEEYLVELEKTRCTTNLVPLVGFGTIRIAGGPGFENRDPSLNELEQMEQYVSEAMNAGAFGMSTGLIYSPQVYAKTSEIIALAKIVASHGGLYFSHIRGEGRTVVDAVKEFIEIVEKSGCRGGQIAHHKIAEPSRWGDSKKTLALIHDANTRGIDITCDQYPFNRGMTSLITLLPPWVHIGGMEKILERLESFEDRKRIKEDITKGIEGWENWIEDVGFENI